MLGLISRHKVLSGAALACTSAGIVYGAGKFPIPQDEGTRRSFHFWIKIFPIYLHYRYYQMLNRDLGVMSDESADKKYLELHELYTDRIKTLTYELRGFYLKHAQMLSVQEGIVPAAYLRWMKDTQDNVPSSFAGTEAREYVRQKLKEELNTDFDELFSHWDDVPIGVASIGQVHKAVLRKTGKTVAVKLLIPNMETIFRADIATMKSFCRLAMPQHLTAFNEIEKQFTTEFDYRLEADNLSKVRRVIMPQWKREVAIPEPYLEYCSKHILVMEYLEGERLLDAAMREFEKVSKLTGRSVEELKKEYWEQMRSGTFRFKTIEQSRRDHARLQWLLTLQDCLFTTNLLRLAYNASPLPYLLGTQPLPVHWTEAPLDLGGVLDLLCRVHGCQILEHGLFNGDPHPGNILMMRDGRLGLIDYGQVKCLSVQQRVSYAKLLLAHSRDDRNEVVRLHFEELGVRTKLRNPRVAYRLSAFYNDRDTDDILEGLNIVDFVDAMEKLDPMVHIADQYLFASRVSLMMRGLGRAFGIKLRMSHMWESEARKFLKQQGIDY